VILAAGYGTRLLPITKAQPKEMLPLVDRPVIHYAVQDAVDAGIEQVIMVTAIGKRAVEDYFDRSRDIEELLREKGDTARLEEIKKVSEMANFAYVRQGEALGLGHAVLTARHLIDNEPFVLILPDDVIIAERSPTQQLIDVYERYGCSVVAVEEVPEDQTSSYGIVVGEPVDERTKRLTRLVEKPAPGTAPSREAIVGRYLFTPDVFEKIERTKPGYGGEIQITDAMQLLAESDRGMYSYRFEGERFDTGRPLGVIIANIALGLRNEEIGPELKRYIQSLKFDEA
jgi:UTP--glucose-1-phosphate uridylyltransferase